MNMIINAVLVLGLFVSNCFAMNYGIGPRVAAGLTCRQLSDQFNHLYLPSQKSQWQKCEDLQGLRCGASYETNDFLGACLHIDADQDTAELLNAAIDEGDDEAGITVLNLYYSKEVDLPRDRSVFDYLDWPFICYDAAIGTYKTKKREREMRMRAVEDDVVGLELLRTSPGQFVYLVESLYGQVTKAYPLKRAAILAQCMYNRLKNDRHAFDYLCIIARNSRDEGRSTVSKYFDSAKKGCPQHSEAKETAITLVNEVLRRGWKDFVIEEWYAKYKTFLAIDWYPQEWKNRHRPLDALYKEKVLDASEKSN